MTIEGGPLKYGKMLRFTKMNGAGNDFVMIDNRAGGLLRAVREQNRWSTGEDLVSNASRTNSRRIARRIGHLANERT